MRRSRLYATAAAAVAVVTSVMSVGGTGIGRSPVGAAVAPLRGPLVASGGKILDEGAGGAVVTLRGVDLPAMSTSPMPGGILDANGLQTLLGWGANFVRLELSSDAYLQRCPAEVYDPNYRSELTDTVNQLTANGVYVVLDVHATNPDCLWAAPQTSNVAGLPGDDVIPTLSGLVGEFAANPLVGYEPFNEPQACAEGTTGDAGQEFVPSSAQARGACSTEALAEQAWAEPGYMTTPTRLVFGVSLGLTVYHTPGAIKEYNTIMNAVPVGDPKPLVFLNPNYFASDPWTFDNLPAPLSTATNVVQVFHPYDCQDEGGGSAICRDSTPETCDVTSQIVTHDMTDPGTGGSWSRPVVIDEFNFPANETTYQVREGSLLVPITVYQHGYWVNNMISAIESQGGSGWALLRYQNADVNDYDGPWSLVVPGIDKSTPTPWQPSANAAPAVASMQGQQLSCETPPFGFDLPL